MFSRHSFILKNVRFYNATLGQHRTSHKFNRQSLLEIIFKRQSLKQFTSYRSMGTRKSSTNKTLPLIVGVAALGGVIGGYAYFNKNNTSDIVQENDDIDDIPFVYEHLEEDLTLLKEYGKIPYLLIGAGSASFAAYRAIRTADPNAKILMIGDEAFYPYMRPPLSKEIWFDQKQDAAETLSFTQWDGKNRSLLYEPSEYYFSVRDILENKNGGVAVIRGTKVVKVDPVSQVVYLDKGGEIAYEKCLVATGSKPKNIPVFENAEESIKKHITFFRTIHDFQNLDKLTKKMESVVIVGGGFLGSELACGISKRRGLDHFKVIQIFPESGNMAKVLPEYLSKWTSKKLINDGIKVIPDVIIKTVTKEENQVVLHLSNDKIIKTDHVIVAVGSDANTEIAKSSGLEVDEKIGGFVVNTEMEARKNLWVAGDASCFYDILLGRRRVEHHDHATVSGGLAGKNMAGLGIPYGHQSMFWSDLGPDIGYEAIGVVDSSLPTVGIFVKDFKDDIAIPDINKNSDIPSVEIKTDKEIENQSEKLQPPEDTVPRAPNQNDNYNKGVIFYLRDDILVGIVLWNVFSKMSIARKIINESKSYDDLTEVAKLFELNSTEE